MKKLLATVCLAFGVSGVFAALAPSASADTICVELYVRVGDVRLINNQDVCV